MREQLLPRMVSKIVFPFIIVYALYVITHGELGPGGGFQGGVILAAAFILYGVIFGADELKRRVPARVTDTLMAFGVLLYAGTGLSNMLLGGRFLDYARLNPASPGDGEALGMTLVEYGVGCTVASVMVTLFAQFTEPAPPVVPAASPPPQEGDITS